MSPPQSLRAWRQTAKPENEWGKVECEPIVPESLWNQVNQIIEEQLKSWKKPGRLPVQAFGNLAHCACGNKMYVRSNSPKYVCRKCHNKIPIVDLDLIWPTSNAPANSAKMKPGRKNFCGAACVTALSAITNFAANIPKAFTIWIEEVRLNARPHPDPLPRGEISPKNFAH